MMASNLRNSKMQGRIDPADVHKLDMVMLAIVYVGFFSCLIRTDYNFIVVLFCYFILQNRPDTLALKIISGAVILLFVTDLLFALTEMPVWTAFDPNNSVWQTLQPMHHFGIFCFVLINILKIILLFFSCKALKSSGSGNDPNNSQSYGAGYQ